MVKRQQFTAEFKREAVRLLCRLPVIHCQAKLEATGSRVRSSRLRGLLRSLPGLQQRMAFSDGHLRQEGVSVGAVVEPHDGLVELGVEYDETIGYRSYIEHGGVHVVNERFESSFRST